MSKFQIGNFSFKTETQTEIEKEEIKTLKEGIVSEYLIDLTFRDCVSPQKYVIT